VVNPGTEVVFKDLILQGGTALDDGTGGVAPGTTAGRGGAILSNGGHLTFDHVIIQLNKAQGADGQSLGLGLPGGDGLEAAGGGVWALGGSLNFFASQMNANQALAGNGGPGGDAKGFFAGWGGAGGLAQGGGLSATNATVSFAGC